MSSSDRILMKSVVDISDQPRRSAKHPQFTSEIDRLHTFDGHWPANRCPSAAAIAKAGFFFAGFGDGTKCFYCDGGLKNWESTDDPWIEHAKWFAECDFLRDSKGQPFILQVLQDFAREQDSGGADDDPVTSGHYRTDPRDIQARMDLPLIQHLLATGYRRNIIEATIERRLRTTGDDFPNMQALIEALHYEDSITPEVGPMEPTVPSGSSCPETADCTTPTATTATTTPTTPTATTATPGGSSAHSSRKCTVEELQRENEALREQVTCKLCMERDINTVFLPCGHLVCCSVCAPSLTQCPICRTHIRDTVKTFLS